MAAAAAQGGGGVALKWPALALAIPSRSGRVCLDPATPPDSLRGAQGIGSGPPASARVRWGTPRCPSPSRCAGDGPTAISGPAEVACLPPSAPRRRRGTAAHPPTPCSRSPPPPLPRRACRSSCSWTSRGTWTIRTWRPWTPRRRCRSSSVRGCRAAPPTTPNRLRCAPNRPLSCTCPPFLPAAQHGGSCIASIADADFVVLQHRKQPQ